MEQAGLDPFNPVLRSEEEILRFRKDCQEIIQKEWVSTGQSSGFDSRCAKIFLQFTENVPEDRIHRVGSTLRLRIDAGIPTSRDSAICHGVEKAMRQMTIRFAQQTGLSPPPGLIYVWILPDGRDWREKWGLDSNIGAVTLMARYVAVPLSTYQVHAPGRVLPFTGASFRRLDTDLRHELTHACFLGWAGRNVHTIPSWFLEGMAVAVAEGVSMEQTWEYRWFERAFKHCRKRVGAAAFSRFCWELTQGGNFDDLLLEIIGYPSYEKIVQELRAKDRARWILLILVASFFLLKWVFSKRSTIVNIQ